VYQQLSGRAAATIFGRVRALYPGGRLDPKKVLVTDDAKLRGAEGNLFFSPYSISTALAMTRAGARGETAAEMDKTLHFTLPEDQLQSAFGALVSREAPAAIDRAFRIYMLPQGMFSVAVATVLFPTLSRIALRGDLAAMRRTVGNGMRQINLLLIPSTAILIVLATPITRLVYQRGQFTTHSTHLVSIALFWFAFSLPFAGINLLLTRCFFAVKRPWIPTRLAALNMIVDAIVSIGLYKPLGIAGLVIGTATANARPIPARPTRSERLDILNFMERRYCNVRTQPNLPCAARERQRLTPSFEAAVSLLQLSPRRAVAGVVGSSFEVQRWVGIVTVADADRVAVVLCRA